MAHDIRDVTTTTDATSTDGVPARPGTGSILQAIVDDISPDGVPRVVINGETRPRTAATMLRFPSAAAASAALLGQAVLVLIGADDVPVIIGPVNQRLWESRGEEGGAEIQGVIPAGQPVQARVDKRFIELEAADEVRLTCGKSALVMRRDGTVIIRGVKIVSRASMSNRIMGATVGIN